MLYLHPTKKLMNFSCLKAHALLGDEMEHGTMQDWYASIAGTGFSDGYFVLYIHRPSLMTVVVKGKTIQETYDIFLARLEKLLVRFSFPKGFIATTLPKTGQYMLFEQSDTFII